MTAKRARRPRPMGILAQALYGVPALPAQPPAPALPVVEMEPLTLTIRQAAKRIGVSHPVLYPHVMNGTLPSVVLGERERRVLTSALPAFLEWLWEQQREELAAS